MAEVQQGDTIEVNYVGRFENGEVFDASKEGAPLTLTVGQGQVIPGFENGMLGLAVGGKTTLNIEPEEGYGEHRPELVQKVKVEQLPPNVEVGQPLQAQVPDGGAITVWIKELGPELAVLDANHPLAGKKLVFDVEVVSIK